jgi:excisionase family DNA binding protein
VGPVTRYLSLAEAARLLGLSAYTVRTKAAAGEIPSRKLPGSFRILFLEHELHAWVDGAELETVPTKNGRVVRPKS